MDDQPDKEDVKDIGASIENNQTLSKETILERSKCLDALAELRQAKWFQARISGRQTCTVIIRILRDFFKNYGNGDDSWCSEQKMASTTNALSGSCSRIPTSSFGS